MNKAELLADYEAQGWTVQPISDWRLVSAVKNKVKYDLNVADLDEEIRTVQVVVTDEGTPEERARPQGYWVPRDLPFTEALRVFARAREIDRNATFAITVEQIIEGDEAAVVLEYARGDNQTVTFERKFVVRRDGAFNIRTLV